MDSDELKYWVAFNRIPRIGRARFTLLRDHFGSLADAWRAGTSELKTAGLDARSAQQIGTRRPTIDPDAELQRLADGEVQAVTWLDDDYPARLKEIFDLPPVLYIRGRLLPDDERSVAVVGTRKPTAYGREAAYRISADLAESGVTVVSGLARGIDAIAHRAALEGGFRTIAVLGSGVDVIYPREHAKLAGEIVEQGALVSEHPMGVRPDAQNFPRRNRIISGLNAGDRCGGGARGEWRPFDGEPRSEAGQRGLRCTGQHIRPYQPRYQPPDPRLGRQASHRPSRCAAGAEPLLRRTAD